MSYHVTPVPFFDAVAGKWGRPIEYWLHNEPESPLSDSQLYDAVKKNWKQIQLFANLEVRFKGFTSTLPTASRSDSKFVIGFLPKTRFEQEHGKKVWAWSNVWWSGGGSSIFDANISVNPSKLNRSHPIESFRGVMLHEQLHAIGLDHTTDKHSIMANAPYNSWRYQGTLRKPDMDTLRTAYPGVVTADTATTIVDEALNFYIPSIEHPTTKKRFWAKLKHKKHKGKHEVEVEQAAETYGRNMKGGTYINKKEELIMDKAYFFGQRYNIKFKVRTDNRFTLVDARLA